MATYTIGVDFGSLSCRAVLVDTKTGKELGEATMEYPHAVMDTVLAASGARLPANYALQDPADYIAALTFVLPAVIKEAGVSPEEVVGIGVDFTCCTMLPVRADGTPLCFEEAFSHDPHAYVKMWKHHAAQPYADRINAVARARGERWLTRAGGAVSSEFMFPKIYQILDEAPAVYDAAYAFMEAGDWITYQLTGTPACAYQFAAYKSQYTLGEGYPTEDFFAAVDERLRHVVRDKLPYPILPQGAPVGRVTGEAAQRFGIAEGTVVAAAAPDAHVAAPALAACRNGDVYAVLGTSACFFVVGERELPVPGICGVQPNGVVPGLFGYEAGLCCLGDHFAYAADKLTSPAYVEEAKARGISMLRLLIEKASLKAPGASGVLALNWWNGNRCILGNSDLSGVFVGMTLGTAPEDLMRALIEATAFGTRNIFENFRACGVEIAGLVVSGGIARKDPFTMQLYADVLNMDIRIAKTSQAPALGSAINGAMAAGVFASYEEASAVMSGVGETVYHPNPAATAVYDKLYAEYKKLHDYFGRGENNVMLTLRQLAAEAGK
ncbi:MAG: ribulokinase [Clostridia bacterium]|nr:ribulokinase [Clostridia bacterium]